jgi:hypothetical protein
MVYKSFVERNLRWAMVAYSVQQIKYEFLLYMKGLGGGFAEWYVGASSDPEETLRRVHRVDDTVPWMYKPAVSQAAVNTLLKYFMSVLNTDGAVMDSASEGARCAYLFRKGPQTEPAA